MTTPGSRRQRWTRGAIVRIALGEQSPRFAFAQMLNEPEYAFFDAFDDSDVPPEDAAHRVVLFRLWVMRTAHSSGRWLKVANASITGSLAHPVQRFKQDPITLDTRLTMDGEDGDLVSAADCDGVECAAIWDPAHVEDRLRDHLARRPNKWAESLRPRLV